MKQLRSTIASILLAASMILSPVCPLSATVQAADTAVGEQSGDRVTPDGAESVAYSVRTGSNHYVNWPSRTIQAYVVPLEDGRLMTINFGQYKDQETGKTKNAMLAGYYQYDAGSGEYAYDASASKTIGLEFPRFGGFYAAEKYYFVLTAQSNPEKSNSKEIFRITKFSREWENLGSVEIKNCNTLRPFAFGTARMDTSGDYLLIRTCHEMYNGHQTNLTIQLNMETMQASFNVPGYASHSLNQFIKVDKDNKIASVDVGDFYSRGLILNVYDGNLSKGVCGSRIWGMCALAFKGSGVYTHATAGGLEISDSSYLIAGSSIDQSPESTSGIYNIYLAAVDKETRKSEVKWLTDEEKTSCRTPHLVKISDNEFLMLWQKDGEDNTIYCSRTDGDGNPVIYDSSVEDNENGTESDTAAGGELKTGRAGEGDGTDTEKEPAVPAEYEIVTLPGNLSECAPAVVSGGGLIWTAASSDKNGTNLSLYEVNLEQLKGADTVSTSAIRVTAADGITYPVSTVETIAESSSSPDEEPGDAGTGPDSGGSGSGSTGSAGGSWSGGTAGTNQPFIQDGTGRYGWDAIIAESAKAAAVQGGGTVTVNMNGVYQVPRRVLESIRGKNVTLVLNVGQGIRWRIYGKDITAETAGDIHLYVKMNAGNIPKDAAERVAGGLKYLKLSFTQKGAFGFPLTLSVRLADSNGVPAIKTVNADGLRMLAAAGSTKEAYAGMYANLFFYDTDKREMQFASAGKIGEDGTADLSVTRGADSILLVSEKQMGGTEPSKDTDTAVTQPETPQQPQEPAQAEVKSVKLSKTVYTYTGKAKKPSVTATDTNGRKISSSDYTVSYKNNKKPGKASVTVTFQNGYSGTVQKTFTIRPAGTSIQKTAALQKGFTVKWKKKTAQTSGYQIQYSTNAGFKAGSSVKVFVKKASVNKKNIKNLKAAKKYYVRIRTYKTVKVNGKNTKIYSRWSAAGKVKTLPAAARK